jgi:hypothetical protein
VEERDSPRQLLHDDGGWVERGTSEGAADGR